MRPRHVVGKPTFIQMHNKPACGFMRRDCSSEGCTPWDDVRLFFICHTKTLERVTNSANTDPQTRGTFILISIGIRFNIPGKGIHVYPGCRLVTGQLWFKTTSPADNTGTPHTKPTCNLLIRSAVLANVLTELSCESLLNMSYTLNVTILYCIGYSSFKRPGNFRD